MQVEGVSTDYTQQLVAYARLLRDWGRRVDLVSPGDLRRVEERHLADSLRLLPLLLSLPPGPCADVGSGAGLPGIPLAIAEPARHWRLLEPRSKRAGFLDVVVRELELSAEVVRKTAQEARNDPSLAASHILVTARALAAPPRAFELVLPLVAAPGVAAVFVGRQAKLPPRAALWAEGIATLSPAAQGDRQR